MVSIESLLEDETIVYGQTFSILKSLNLKEPIMIVPAWRLDVR